MELSNEQFEFLKTLNFQTIMLVDPAMSEVCRHLSDNGYVKMISVLTVDKDIKCPPNELRTNSQDIIIQITEKGRAYLDSHIKHTRNIKIEHILSASALACSIILGILGLIF